MAVFIPMSRPFESSSAPPELPGLIAASVWITLEIGRPEGEVTYPTGMQGGAGRCRRGRESARAEGGGR